MRREMSLFLGIWYGSQSLELFTLFIFIKAALFAPNPKGSAGVEKPRQ